MGFAPHCKLLPVCLDKPVGNDPRPPYLSMISIAWSVVIPVLNIPPTSISQPYGGYVFPCGIFSISFPLVGFAVDLQIHRAALTRPIPLPASVTQLDQDLKENPAMKLTHTFH